MAIKLSTGNLSLLPNPTELKQICKSISALEATICPEWEYRYYSYNKDWSETEEFYEMRNGQGDQMLILFSKEGACINGFAHESELNGWRQELIEKQAELVQEIVNGIFDELPTIFQEFVFGEPVRSIGTTFCIWQTDSGSQWKTGKVKLPKDNYKDGSADLLQLLDGRSSTYTEWAEGYYEDEFKDKELNLNIVEKIFKGNSQGNQSRIRGF